MQKTFSNIILIGMAGAGKSTIGPILARIAHKQYLDSDDMISKQTGMTLQHFLNSVGQAEFQKTEEQVLEALDLHGHVLATGGSAVYCTTGMRHLQKNGCIVLLDVDLATLEQRVKNKTSRGLINPDGGSFQELYHSRYSLYRLWADIRIKATGTPDAIAREIHEAVRQFQPTHARAAGHNQQ